MADRKRTPLPDPDDRRLFREAVQGVEPLQQDRTPPFRRPRRPKPLPPAPETTPEPLADQTIETPEWLLFARPGVQKRVLQTLQKGRIPPADTLDLHGLRVHQAQPVFIHFLRQARQRGLRSVLIIHGKGRGGATGTQPVLKQKTNQWLRQFPFVLAFCSAIPADGGTGATYVLLSRKQGADGRR